MLPIDDDKIRQLREEHGWVIDNNDSSTLTEICRYCNQAKDHHTRDDDALLCVNIKGLYNPFTVAEYKKLQLAKYLTTHRNELIK